MELFDSRVRSRPRWASFENPTGGAETGEFTVTFDKACVVLVKSVVDGKDEYTRLHATAVEGEGNENTYRFDIDEFTGTIDDNTEIIVAVRGDVDGDGKVDLNDVLNAQRSTISKYTMTKLQTIITDTDDDGDVDLNDVLNIQRNTISKFNFVW